jgi:hypothetical protein
MPSPGAFQMKDAPHTLPCGYPRTAMPLPDEIRVELAPLYQALWGVRNSILPVVGSGLSQGMPSWKALLESLIGEIGDAGCAPS